MSRQAATQRQRKIVGASLSAVVIAAMLAGIALWQRAQAVAEADRAARSEKAAEATTREAQITQSGLLSEAAIEVLQLPGESGAPLAMLLALEAMPDERAGVRRPLLPDAQVALADALEVIRERRVWPHESAVNSATWSPDGRFIATASGDATARVFDAESGRELMRLAHGEDVLRAIWSPNGRLLVTASKDATARVFDAASGRQIRLIPHGDEVRHVALSPDGRLIATASKDKSLRIIEAVTGKLLFRIAHHNGVSALAWSPEGRLVATASVDRSVRILEALSGIEIGHFEHPGEILSLAWSPDGQLLATASSDHSARVIDPVTRRELMSLAHDSWVSHLAWSPDGQFVATASLNGIVRVFVASSGREDARFHRDGWVNHLAWSPDGRLLATASGNLLSGEARVLELGTNHEVARLAHARFVSEVAWSPDGRLLATAASDGTTRVLDVKTRKTDRDARSQAIFLEDGMPVLSESDFRSHRARMVLEKWKKAQALVDAGQDAASRCLSRSERLQYFLSAAPPTWCVERRLWPYHGEHWQAWLPRQKAWLAGGRQGNAPPLPKAE